MIKIFLWFSVVRYRTTTEKYLIFQRVITLKFNFYYQFDSIILQHMSDILALFSNPNSYKLEASQETFTPTVIALIVISVLMFIGIIVLIGYIHSTTKK